MAEPWIRVHANIADKPVVWRAVEALKITDNEAIGLLVRLWGALSQHAIDGGISDIVDAQIEAWAGWKRKKGRFAAFVREHHTDRDGRLNEWDEYQGPLITRRSKDAQRQAEKRQRDKTQREERDASRDSHADSPRDTRVTSALTRANETIRDETRTALLTTDQPPRVILTAAANRGISERWGEQINSLDSNSGRAYEATEAIEEAGVPLDFARDAVYTYALTCKPTDKRPPRSLTYFSEHVIGRWRAEGKREEAKASEATLMPVKVPRGATTIGIADTRGEWLWGLYRVHGMTRNVPKSERERVGEELVAAGHFPSVEAFLDEMRITEPWTLEDARSDRWAAEMINSRLLSAAGKVA